MWRSSPSRRLLGALLGGPSARPFWWRSSPSPHLFSTTPPRFPSPPPSTAAGGGGGADPGGESMTGAEAKKLMRLVNVETLKRRLGMEAGEVIGYKELLEACEGVGLARSRDEAATYARVLDDAGVVLLFRDKVYLHPDKVVELVRKAVPLALTPEDDPRREEMKQLQEKKKEIDALAHRQVRRILWSGLGFFVFQISLFFRLTFWEFSWDVMEPIAFFSTTAGILVGYAYFLFTSRNPTYQDLMKRLFLLRQRKLVQKQCFDISRFEELQRHCRCPLDHVEESELEAFQRN